VGECEPCPVNLRKSNRHKLGGGGGGGSVATTSDNAVQERQAKDDVKKYHTDAQKPGSEMQPSSLRAMKNIASPGQFSSKKTKQKRGKKAVPSIAGDVNPKDGNLILGPTAS